MNQAEIDLTRRIGFEQGVVWACAEIIRQHDLPGIAVDVFRSSGVSVTACAEEDVAILRQEIPNLPKGTN